MKSVVLFLAAAVAVASASSSSKIIGGSAAAITDYPFNVAILQQSLLVVYSHGCGGTILNEVAILTGAQCVSDYSASGIRVRVGSTNHNSGGTVVNADSLITHPDYDSSTYDNDIAIVRLSSFLTFSSSIAAVSIAGPNYIAPDGATVLAYGWGVTSYGGSKSDDLQVVELDVVNAAICAVRYSPLGYTVSDSMLCTGKMGTGGADQCEGDSGGPVTYAGVQVGITSWAYQCATAYYPTVSTKVGSYVTWIQANSQ